MEKTIVAVDAMGGDNAPVEIVKGAVEAVLASEQVVIKLVGKEDIVKEELAKYEFKNNIEEKDVKTALDKTLNNAKVGTKQKIKNKIKKIIKKVLKING